MMTPAEETALGMVVRGVLVGNGVRRIDWDTKLVGFSSDDFDSGWNQLSFDLQERWKSLTRLLVATAQSLPAPPNPLKSIAPAKREWGTLIQAARDMGDQINETLGQPSLARELSPDAQLYAKAVATLLYAFARTINVDLPLDQKL
jgi:hypothetical protein